MSPIHPIFRNQEQQVQFEKDGYLKIQLLEPEDIHKLQALFKAHFPNPSNDFFSSSYENNADLKSKISASIGDIILPKIEKVFQHYTWFGSAFLSKGNGPRSEMPMHQDWTIVDETKYVALNIWTPLQETDEENGTLEVLKGSHRWHNTPRAPTLPFYFDGYQELLKTALTPIPTMPGEAIVLNQSVIHYSKANRTNTTRVAITSGIKTQHAPMIFHYWDKNKPNEIEQYVMEENFLNSFTNFHQSIYLKPSMGKSVGLLPFTFEKPAAAAVNQLIIQNKEVLTTTLNTTENKSFVKKFIEWLNK